MLYVTLGLVGLCVVGLAWLLREVYLLKEVVSKLQHTVIDMDYSLKMGWERNSEKLKRLVKRLDASNQGDSLPLHCVTYKNADRKLYVTSPMMNLLTLAREDNIAVSSGCYGEGTCGQCAFVPVEGHEHLSPRTEKEQRTTQMFNYPETARLSCQCRVTGDVTVELLNPLESLGSPLGDHSGNSAP